MPKPKYFFLFFSLLSGMFLFISVSFSQNTNISGVINIYTSVTSIPAGNCIDSFSVASTNGFNVGDSILIIEMQGATIDTSNTITFGTFLNFSNSGNFELAKINSIAGNTIRLTSHLTRNYDVAGNIQIVSYPQYVNATVTGTLTAPNWNGVSGGVLAFSVSGTLTLNANIDLSGKGSRGGTTSNNFWSGWYYQFCFGNANRGGQKGEGIVPYLPNKGYGRGPQGNGGGGGNDINTAGAGGANYGRGGHGGYAYQVAPDTLWGMTSKNLDTGIVHGKIYLGGGGGGGHQNNSAGTVGENGGGIIVLHANTISGNGNSIKSDGIDNNLVATIDGAGGGGAGGSIFIQAQNFNTNLTIEVKGGKGGDEVYALQCHGNGGGGGGGLIETTLASFPGNVTTNVAAGLRGNGTCYNTAGDAANGDPGIVIYNYSVNTQTILTSNTFDSICTGQSIQIGPNNTSGVTYQWNNGPTTSTQTVNPLVTTTYILTISDSVCSGNNAYDTVTVDVLTTPVASFTFTQNCDSVIFANTSTGGNSYQWNFGDGNNSVLNNPSHTYNIAGSYTVTLIVINGTCNDTVSQTLTVGTNPVAAFTPITNNCSLTIGFTNNSTGSAIYNWNFGDGNTDTVPYPSHTYLTPGTYTITLFVGTGPCVDSISQTITIPPVAVASFTPIVTNCSLSVGFTNNSAGSTIYNWNFGDGNTDTIGNPNHTYVSPGTYIVNLIVGSGNCADTISQSITITQMPVASFTPITNNCSLTIGFTNNSTGSAIYNWNFGDGNTDTVQNPNHTYLTPGTYIIKLIVGSGACVDSITQSITIPPLAIASFTSLTNNCNLSVALTNTSTNSNVFHWDFGDNQTSNLNSPNHTYANSGTFTISLIAGTGNCADTITQTVTVNPTSIAGFTPTILNCDPSVSFTNNSLGFNSYSWNFGDGDTSNLTNPIHTYNVSGSYWVKFIAVSGGCNDTINQEITINPIPVASFAYGFTGCNFIVNFTNNSSGGSTYHWNFGDGDTSNNQTPVHTYSTMGNYSVTLIVTNSAGCSDTIIQPVNTTILVIPDFNWMQAPCDPNVVFTNVSTNNFSSYWQLGDGETSTGTGVDHTYNIIGNYNVTLIINDGTPCKATITKTINVTTSNTDELYIPNAFTPNGDGINDYFVVQSINDCVPYEMSIYNRWGQMIFYTDSFPLIWDGTFNGDPVPTGSYVYLIRGGNFNKTGIITVIR